MKETFYWWMKLSWVILKITLFSIFCIFMKIVLTIIPTARKRYVENLQKHLKTESHDYLQWINESTMSDFLFSWRMVRSMYQTLMQDMNKTAALYCQAPNPSLHTPVTGDTKNLLSVATSNLPLIINFGSCT